ncbi:hypothetical protein FOL47_000467 [Perkinsus chesapeaki]|uniref:Uncharacterized protein n=1 Tax=Perkinsus chesapeaki TaxID=330153 RepID=A0A7J6MLJ5_PERCH|nr:hypothetical protein FOL47_000467 [Perkinsus chesapeaki]
MGLPNFNTFECREDVCVACLAGTDAQRKAREQFCRQAKLNNDPPYQLPGRDPTKTYRTLSPPKIVGNDPSKWTVKDGGWRLPNVNVGDCRGTACLQCRDDTTSRREYCESQGGTASSFQSAASLSPGAAREVAALAEQEMGSTAIMRIRQAATAFERNPNSVVRRFGKFLRAVHHDLQGVMR